MNSHVPTVVLDNGASTMKCCAVSAHGDPMPMRIVPNAIIRSKGDKTVYFGHEFTTDRCRDFASLSYRLPFEKGYLVDWDAQKAIWDGVFSDKVLNADTTESSLLLTEPYFNLPNIQEVYDQFVFEEYEFNSYYRCTPASLVPHSPLMGLPPPECMLLIDSGFSFTHVVPLICGNIVWNAVKRQVRLDIGGKLLTNHLKELVSFRQWNMMDETYIVNDVKESCCFVSNDFRSDLEACRGSSIANDIVREYILPDMSKNRSGRIRQRDDILADSDQVLVMNNERFSVPEIMFSPDIIGLNQAGLPGAVAASISLLPEDLQGMFWANIGVFGANTKLPGFRERLLSELRSLAPASDDVCIYECENPITAPLDGALNFVQTSAYQDLLVTREEYLEGGSNAIRRKWKDWKGPRDGEQDSSLESLEKVPKKKLTVSVSIPAHRGAGRPRKDPSDAETETVTSRAEPELPHRGPGRPRKRLPTPEDEDDEMPVISVPARRGPGRPRKNPMPV
ncbi:actin-domain-containing protein [Hymenopellis radicata]|nr:actin-domain-containing protein [Hymenopellis radicata]